MWRTALRVTGHCLRRPASVYRRVQLPVLPPPVQPICVRREYSIQPQKSTRTVYFAVPNPVVWMRMHVYSFLIRTFLDKDFDLEDFSDGVRQAFLLVSNMLSQGKFDALENLVVKEIMTDLQHKCSKLPDNYRKALAVESNEIIYAYPWDVALNIEDGKNSVHIRVRYLYRKQLELPEKTQDGVHMFEVFGKKDEKNKLLILGANYEFSREFTKGKESDWIITHITHSDILE